MTFFDNEIMASSVKNGLNCYLFYNLNDFVLPNDLSCFMPDADVHDRSGLYLKTRVLLRSILSLYSSIKASDISFNYDNAKPRLNNFNNIDFNISHAGDSFAVVVGFDCKCGVDLEYKRVVAYKHRVAKRFAMSSDIAGLSDDSFVRLWTRTEAVVKCMGQGMFSHAKLYNVLRDGVLLNGMSSGLNVSSWDRVSHYLSIASNYDKYAELYSYDFSSPGWVLSE